MVPRKWERNFCGRYGPKDHPETIVDLFSFLFEGKRSGTAIAQSSKASRSRPGTSDSCSHGIPLCRGGWYIYHTAGGQPGGVRPRA
jgi:hypothetical protein